MWPPLLRMSPDERASFVENLFDSRIFTANHIRPDQLEAVLGQVFQPVGNGSLDSAPREYAQAIGTLWEYREHAIGMLVPAGYPVFATVQAICKDDWDEILKVFVAGCEERDLERMRQMGVETRPA